MKHSASVRDHQSEAERRTFTQCTPTDTAHGFESRKSTALLPHAQGWLDLPRCHDGTSSCVTRHPVLQLLELEPDEATMKDWETPEMKTLMETLIDRPHQVAFYEENLPDPPAAPMSSEDDPSDVEHPPLEDLDTVDLTPAQVTGPNLAALQSQLEHDVALSEVLMKDAFIARSAAAPDTDEDSEGSISKGPSESSHELGAPTDSEGTCSTSEEELLERHGDALYGPPIEPFSKGQKRRVQNAVNQVMLAFEKEQVKQCEKEEAMSKLITPVPRTIKRKTGWKVLEIFTWSCMLSSVAWSLGWEFLEPITWPHWNLSQQSEREAALEYLDRCNPDLLVIAWPCKHWSPLQNLARRTRVQKQALEEVRLEERKTLLSFSRQAALLQRRKKKALIGENPDGSAAWETPEIIDGFEGLAEATLDQCQYGLGHPNTKMPIRKRTRVMGQQETLTYLHQRCPGNHEHAHIEGNVTIGGQSMSLSAWTGGYSVPLCQAMVAGAERYLKSERKEVYHTALMPEEILMNGEETIPAPETPEETEVEDNVQETPMQPAAAEDDLSDLEVKELEVPTRPPEDVAPPPPVIDQAAPDQDRRFPIAPDTRKAVEQAHRQLGHPSRATLVRMLRLSGASEGAIENAKTWRCDTCATRAPPRHPTASAPGLRPYGFNKEHQVDLKYVKDCRGKKYVFLSMIDVGTVYHHGVMLKTRRSEYVASKWLKHWVSQFGVLARIIHDQGGEFESGFSALLEDLSLPSTVTGAHSGWQLSLAERHGGMLALIVDSIVTEHQIEGFSDMKRALAAAIAAKNMTVSKDGYTPCQRLFGSDVRFPGLTDEEERLSFAEALGTEGEVARAHKMRMTARMALLREDVQSKLRRSILRRPQKSTGPFPPGAQIYFWAPRKAQRRYFRGEWRGPATVLFREGQKRYFVSWRGRCLLLSEENMRMATGEELALQSPVPHQDLKDLQNRLRDPDGNRGYQDGSNEAAPPKGVPDPPAPRLTLARQVWRTRGKELMKGLRSAKRLIKDLPYVQRQAAKRRKMLTDQRQPALPAAPPVPQEEDHRPRALMPPAPEAPQNLMPPILPIEARDRSQAPVSMPAAPEQEQELPPVPDTPMHWAEPPASTADLQPAPLSHFHRELLDDVPYSIRERGKRAQAGLPPGPPDKKKLKTAFVFTLSSLVGDQDGPQNEWLSKYEIALLRNLTGLDVTSARLHRAPRKKMQVPTKERGRARTSILIGEDPSITYIIEENAAQVQQEPKKKAPFLWTGLSIFHKPPSRQTKTIYIQVPQGIIESKMAAPDAQEFQELWNEEVKDLLVSDALVLRLKENKKELDPKLFDAQEWKEFKKADQKEWVQWLSNKVVRFLSAEEARKVPRNKVFRAPMRIVRVNRAADRMSPLVAKSRLIIPGHLDPEIGTYRTDSPTAASMTTRLVKQLAASRGYDIYSFDVTTAFLSGKATDREIYVRAPPDGLPEIEDGVHKMRAIKPYELMQVLKSAYGLTESPRLWYLEAKEGLNEVGLKELKASRSTFIASENGKSWAMCSLHVDDGLLIGLDSDSRFVALRDRINKRFKIKEWKHLNDKGPLSFLGVDLHLESEGLTDRMDKYVEGIDPLAAPKRKPEDPLTADETSQYRRLVMKMRWPAQHCMPQMLYSVSKLAQKVTKATVQDFKDALKTLSTMKEEAKLGRARLWYQKIPEEELQVFSYFDASLGKEDQGRSQLASVHFVGSKKVLTGPGKASVVEFTTNKSTRVVRSSMAAEANSMCIAADRHLYIRLILQQLLSGQQDVGSQWRERLRVPGSLVTDARSLFDHLTTTGQIPTERQTLLHDLLTSKDLVESQAVSMKWVPTYKQYADFLTKAMIAWLWNEYQKTGLISLRETKEEAKQEDYRRGLRKAQRQRRKDRMKKIQPAPKPVKTTGTAKVKQTTA